MQGNKELYAYGQAGFSVHFPDDSREMIIGLPGVYEWKGNDCYVVIYLFPLSSSCYN